MNLIAQTVEKIQLRVSGVKNIKMEDVREGEEQGGTYEIGSDINVEEYNKLESAREEFMVQKSVELEEEMVVDDGRNMLSG